MAPPLAREYCENEIFPAIAQHQTQNLLKHQKQQQQLQTQQQHKKQDRRTSLASSPGHPHRIFHCEYRPDSDNHFVSVGVRHISFWDQVGGALVQKRGVAKSLGNRVYRKVTFLSLAFGMNNTTYSGSVTGDVYVWRDVELVRVVQMIGRGPIFSMFTSLFDGLIVTGCKERNESKDHAAVKLWDQEMSKCKSYSIPSLWDNNNNGVLCVKSLSRVKGKILVGTKDSNIFEVNEKTAEVTLVASYHGDGELWGLTNHRNNKTFATTGDDGMLKIWDIHKSLALKSVSIGPCRTIHFSSTGSLLAAGLKNGTIKIFETSKYDVVFEKRFRGSVINVIRFSPNDGYVVTLSEDSFMDMYEVNAGVDSIASLTRSSRDTNNSQPDLLLKRLSTFNFDRSTGISLDFSDDCQFIKVGTDAYTNRYFQVPTLTEVLDASLVAKIFFTNITSVSGSEMVGAWPRNASSRHHVNCCHVSSSHKNVVTGDDYGLVKLLKFPANPKNVPFQYYVGHSAHVTNILFTGDQSHVMSIGGDDSSLQCVIIFRTLNRLWPPDGLLVLTYGKAELSAKNQVTASKLIGKPTIGRQLLSSTELGRLKASQSNQPLVLLVGSAPNNTVVANTKEVKKHKLIEFLIYMLILVITLQPEWYHGKKDAAKKSAERALQ
ncbi:hypothetical protein HELRODRAFT_181949 [Helobdella robusta]|uniref:EML-like second beta-propeller domain-containing protein n=1 Tax=Helobdella robusta TaxID=6412 RepID=T1FHH8_HELRO|nr:hypothetical protein HELRODRAFT_181949 [Helobdella robusta]ESN91893.1 hypothetical protein HELRODRAFT_181949 [Helobdella robusta]